MSIAPATLAKRGAFKPRDIVGPLAKPGVSVRVAELFL